ncbi:MAG: hypothetical protein WCC60_04860 [Ilumatobacteraceae bacterium]
MSHSRALRSCLVVGVCALGIAMLPGSGAAQPGRTAAGFVSRPPTGEPPAKPFQRSSGVAKPAPVLRAEGTAGGYVFVPINPYRTLDSRAYADGFMLAGDSWFFDVITDVGGAVRIPSTAVAVTYNLTATGTFGAGYCALYPANISWPGNSSINWSTSNQSIANGGTVSIGYLDAPGQVEIYCGEAGQFVGTDFVLDITGYYI